MGQNGTKKETAVQTAKRLRTAWDAAKRPDATLDEVVAGVTAYREFFDIAQVALTKATGLEAEEVEAVLR